MPIAFTCPHCGHQTLVDDRYAGQQGPCAACGKTIVVPGTAQPTAAPATTRTSNKTAWIIAVVAAVAICCGPGLLIALLLPAVQNARETARRTVCVSNMRQIQMAISDYEIAHGHYPPAYLTDDNGKPMHSWRVLILPQLGYRHLYDRYSFDEPWDGPNNRKLADQMPEMYACPSAAGGAPYTNYVLIEGPGAIFEGSKEPTQQEISHGDGLLSTLMVVETTEPIHWMEPRDLDFRLMPMRINAPGGISSNHPMGANAAFSDSSMKYLENDLPETTVRAMITPNGGETVQP